MVHSTLKMAAILKILGRTNENEDISAHNAFLEKPLSGTLIKHWKAK